MPFIRPCFHYFCPIFDHFFTEPTVPNFDHFFSLSLLYLLFPPQMAEGATTFAGMVGKEPGDAKDAILQINGALTV